MVDLFISYSHHDRKRVDQIASALKKIGVKVWYDPSLSAGSEFSRESAGSEFSREIKKQLGEAKAVLICWSRNAVSSEWVQKEGAEAERNKKLVTCRLEECQIEFPFNNYHAVDIADWAGDWGHDGLWRIIQGIGERMNRPGICHNAGPPNLYEGLLDPSRKKLAAWAKKYPTDPFADTIRWETKQREQFTADLVAAKKQVDGPWRKRQLQAQATFDGMEKSFDNWVAQGPSASSSDRPDPKAFAISWNIAPPVKENWAISWLQITFLVFLLLAFTVLGAALHITIGKSNSQTELNKAAAENYSLTKELSLSKSDDDSAQKRITALSQELEKRQNSDGTGTTSAATLTEKVRTLQTLIDANNQKIEVLQRDAATNAESLKTANAEKEVFSNESRENKEALEVSQKHAKELEENNAALQASVDSDRTTMNNQTASAVVLQDQLNEKTLELQRLQSKYEAASAKNDKNNQASSILASGSLSKFHVFPNRSIQGRDIALIKDIENRSSCSDRCMKATGCRAYSFQKRAKMCFLKNGIGPLLLNPRTDTGLEPSYSPILASNWEIQHHDGKGFLGQGYISLTESLTECESKCRSDERCVAYTHQQATNSCKLFDKTNEEFITMKGAYTGLKMQE